MSSYRCFSALKFSIVRSFISKLWFKSNNSSNESSSQGHDESSSYNSKNDNSVPPNSPISSREGSPIPSANSREISPAPLDKTREGSKTPPFTLVPQELSRGNAIINTISDLSFIYSSSASETFSSISSSNISLLYSEYFLASPRAFEPSNTPSPSPCARITKPPESLRSNKMGQNNQTKPRFTFGPLDLSKNSSNQLSDNSTAKADESSNSDENKENILPSQTSSPTNSDLTNTASSLVEFNSTKDESKMFSGPLFGQSLNSTAVAYIEDTPSKILNTNPFTISTNNQQPDRTDRYDKAKSRDQLLRGAGKSEYLLTKPTESQTLPGSQHKSSGMAVTQLRDEVGDRVTKLQSDDGRIFAECKF